jgi:hypothetical protein
MIKITKGDDDVDVVFRLKSGDGTSPDLTGATFASAVLGADDTEVALGNSLHAADVDQDANPGKVTITLASAKILLMKTGQRDVKIVVTQGTSVITYWAYAQLFVKGSGLEN